MQTIKNVKIVAECPACKEKKFAENAQVIKESEVGQMSHVVCKKCNTAFIVLVAQSALGLAAYSIMTDLSGSEAEKVLDAGKVTSDDVLDIHERLNNF